MDRRGCWPLYRAIDAIGLSPLDFSAVLRRSDANGSRSQRLAFRSGVQNSRKLTKLLTLMNERAIGGAPRWGAGDEE